jgi:osmoprotectant transport system ATP-binding protein
MNASAAGIAVDGVVKRYDGRTVLDVTALDVLPRSTLALIGPSGCGKSTLLRVIAGLVTPDRGTVHIGGEAMQPARRRALRLRMGYVIQDGGLFPHLTAYDNAAIVARDLGWRTDAIRTRIDELAAFTRLDRALLARFPAQLSGGQRQRVGLVRALMLDPEVLLMDEPLGALDPMVRAQLQEDLKELFGRLRRSVLLVTHDMGEAAFLGDTVALMREGRIVQRGLPGELLARPADPFVTEFIRAQRRLAAPEARP